jgi:hypothetical protein
MDSKRSQVEGFALFCSPAAAQAGVSLLHGFDFEDNLLLRVKMANNNLILRVSGRGAVPARQPRGLGRHPPSRHPRGCGPRVQQANEACLPRREARRAHAPAALAGACSRPAVAARASARLQDSDESIRRNNSPLMTHAMAYPQQPIMLQPSGLVGGDALMQQQALQHLPAGNMGLAANPVLGECQPALAGRTHHLAWRGVGRTVQRWGEGLPRVPPTWRGVGWAALGWAGLILQAAGSVQGRAGP